MAAMKKVFRKYNFQVGEKFMMSGGFISQTRQSKNASTTAIGMMNITGSVAANPGENAALFLSPVDIGGQTVNLDFDSGSSDL